ncbi:probable G-protein coupled receptor 33 [Dermochelys coriacea]|uniref:probable G-protein coupled receptor 33 n=1 Tax=Dermochelys coriacea TaxID=27794 RepID=UPI001CA8AE3B|nr:probable G-protein coupled receptor 33 [Dermochelys coriacea]
MYELNAYLSLGMFSAIFLLTLTAGTAALSPDPRLVLPFPHCDPDQEAGHGRVAGLLHPQCSLTPGVVCKNSYTPSGEGDGAETPAWGRRLHLLLFRVQFLLDALLPLLTSVGCQGRKGLEIKKKGMVRSRKPFKVMVTAVVSSFICWLPNHLCHGLLLYKNAVPVSVTSA